MEFVECAQKIKLKNFEWLNKSSKGNEKLYSLLQGKCIYQQNSLPTLLLLRYTIIKYCGFILKILR